MVWSIFAFAVASLMKLLSTPTPSSSPSAAWSTPSARNVIQKIGARAIQTMFRKAEMIVHTPQSAETAPIQPWKGAS